jgi:hypothetical protein
MSGVFHRALAALLLVGMVGCGGSGGGGGTPRPTRTPTAGTTPTMTTPTGTPPTASVTATVTPTSNRTAPPTRTPGGGPSILPDICNIGRVVFRSHNGEKCCIAADPVLLPPKPQPGQPILVLTDLPIGPATVTIDGYVENFAPLPEDVTATCKTLNTSGVRPCDTLDASAAYGSAPKAITIFGGVRVNLGDIVVSALPFLLDIAPPQNAEVEVPVDMTFTVVDPETGIAAPSVALDITLDVPQGEPPVFHPITKRVPIHLDPCKDGGDAPCSREDNLNVTGFKAQAVAEYLSYLPAGPVAARITAQNLADPPRDLDFRYMFFVVPNANATPTPIGAAALSGDAGNALFVPTPTPTSTPVEP